MVLEVDCSLIWTLYFEAGKEEIVHCLVEHNAAVNVQSQEGFTPLYMAAQAGFASIVQYLLSHGADENINTKVKNDIFPHPVLVS